MKLPWKDIKESSRESSEKLSELSDKVDQVLDRIDEAEYNTNIEEICHRLGKIETSLAVIYESGSQKELDLLASNRAMVSAINKIQERIIEMDYLASPEAHKKLGLLSSIKSRTVDSFKTVKGFLTKNHLLISSLLFMATAALGVVYLVTYLL